MNIEPTSDVHLESFRGREERLPPVHFQDRVMSSITDGGEILSIVEFTHLWNGCAVVAMIVSDEARGRRRFGFVRACRRLVEKYAKAMGLRRMTCIVHCDEPEYRRFAELLGFVAEFRDVGYVADGSDCWIMTKRWDGVLH